MRCLALALSLGLVACAAKGPPPPSSPSPLAGAQAPQFSRDTLDGRNVDTEALAGKVWVVKFFAEYCEPCKRTLPEAQRLHERYDDVAFIGVSEDERQDAAVSLIRTYGLTFPVVLDRGNVLSGRFRVSELPITFVVDATGTVRWVGGPEQDDNALERAIRAARG
mgnify:CR=1 FL=1